MNGYGIKGILVRAYQSSPLGRTSAECTYVIFSRETGLYSNIDLIGFSNTQGCKIIGAAVNTYSEKLRFLVARTPVHQNRLAELFYCYCL